MRIRILTSLIICISQNAYAGAWAREKGELFIAAGGNFLLSSGAQLPVHYDPTLYAEFGATERLTFGLDLHTADKGRIGTVFIFTNFPIGDTKAQDRYSAGFALGARADAYHATETLLRGHVSWGARDRGWLACRRCICHLWNPRPHISPKGRCNLGSKLVGQLDDNSTTPNGSGLHRRLLRQNCALDCLRMERQDEFPAWIGARPHG